MIVDVDNVLAWRLHCDKLAAVDWLLKIAVSRLDKYAIVHMFGFVKMHAAQSRDKKLI
jgi:hypothetical protein